MTWLAYHVALRLASPIHIGWRRFGNIRQTRPYVLGRTLWGAFTARLGRDSFHGNYESAHTVLTESVRFGYLYPSSNISGCDVPDCWPWDPRPGEFEWRYLQSYMSTSLRDGRSKMDGSLHEIEYLAPYTRDGNCVWLVGVIWVKDGVSSVLAFQSAHELSKFLLSLSVGADRGCGWGRFRDAQVCALSVGSQVLGTGWHWSEQQGEIILSTPQTDSPLLAHLGISNRAEDWNGAQPVSCEALTVEPLVGRMTPFQSRSKAHGTSLYFGSEIPPASICIVPGSIIRRGTQLVVGDFGIWRQAEWDTTSLS